MKKSLIKKLGLVVSVMSLSLVCALPAFAKDKLDTPEDLYWSSTSKEDDSDYDEGSYAKWDEVEEASKYELTLYREDADGGTHTVKSGVTTKKTYYNFRSLMDKEGDYYFRVKAIASGSSYSDSSWSDYSDTFYVSSSYAENSSSVASSDGPQASIYNPSKWVLDSIGWRYQNSDGTYLANCWFQDPSDGNWYYFDAAGYMQTGWIDDNGTIYYCDINGTPSGAMVTGLHEIDGQEHLFSESGAMEY